MQTLPFNITPELQITECKPLINMRFRLIFKYNSLQAQAIYAWGNNRYTTLGVQGTILEENAMMLMDEVIEENHIAIGQFLRQIEQHIKEHGFKNPQK